LKALSAAKEHTNEERGGGRDPGVRRPVSESLRVLFVLDDTRGLYQTVVNWIQHTFVCIVDWIEVNLKNLKTTLINHSRLRTKGQSAGYPQSQIEITSNSFQRRTAGVCCAIP